MTGGLAGLEELLITCHDFEENGEFEIESPVFNSCFYYFHGNSRFDTDNLHRWPDNQIVLGEVDSEEETVVGNKQGFLFHGKNQYTIQTKKPCTLIKVDFKIK